jgi:hypothetical protein
VWVTELHTTYAPVPRHHGDGEKGLPVMWWQSTQTDSKRLIAHDHAHH